MRPRGPASRRASVRRRQGPAQGLDLLPRDCREAQGRIIFVHRDLSGFVRFFFQLADAREDAAAATWIVLRTYSGTRGGLKGAVGENARSNSQSRKRRRSCPSLSLGVRGPPPSTDADVWRKCIVFCKNAFRDPEPNSSSRRRSRGVLGRFGRLVGRPCPLYEAAYDGIDPGAAGTSGAYRELPVKRRASTYRAQDVVP